MLPAGFAVRGRSVSELARRSRAVKPRPAAAGCPNQRRFILRHLPPSVAKASQFFALGRTLSVAGLLALLAFYAYVAFRPDSSFANYTPLPRSLWQTANAVDSRNYWAFALLGLYVATLMKADWKVWKAGKIGWITIGLLLLPLVKESLQNLVHGRHGTLLGASQGFAGVWSGLLLGAGLRCCGRWFGRGNPKTSQPTKASEGNAVT